MLDFLKRLVTPGQSRKPESPAAVGNAPPVPGTTRPYVLWADEYDPPVTRPCPNCGSTAPKPPLLTVRFTSPEQPMRFARVLHCPDCTCHFYELQKLPEYAEDAMVRRGRVPFYLQQGAGISLITTLLARTGRPPGSRLLDVGCGFGFGLDFATRTLQWRAQGIDPARIAALGREMLGVAIEPRYLGDDEPELKAACDVVLASEVIEHVASPIAFARTLRNVLRPGGILILTTPDAADLQPQTAAGALVGLLAPGWHLVFQNRASMEALLRRVGFSDVIIEKDGNSLVAYASDRPFRLETDRNAPRAAYVDYLTGRMGDFPSDHDLLLGFAGRALQEASNDNDAETAERSYQTLREACQGRFGIDLDSIVEIPDEAATCSLERLAELMPLSLGCLLYADAMRRLARGEPRPQLEQRLLCAADAADAVRRAVGELAQEDALSEEIAWVARAEAALCVAAAGGPDTIARVLALPPFPGADEQHLRPLPERALVALVNAGHHALGAELADATGLQAAAWTNPANDADPSELSDIRRDALFCLAVLDLRAPDADACSRAVRRVRAGAATVSAASGRIAGLRGLFWAATQGEMQALERLGFADQVPALLAASHADAGTPPGDVAATASRIATAARTPDHLVELVNAGRYDEARLLASALGNYAATDHTPTSDTDRDRWFSLAVLDMQPGGDASRAVRRFAAVRASLPGPGAALYWPALRGEVEATALLDGAEAADALRHQALQELEHFDGAIPDDLRFARQRDDETPAP